MGMIKLTTLSKLGLIALLASAAASADQINLLVSTSTGPLESGSSGNASYSEGLGASPTYGGNGTFTAGEGNLGFVTNQTGSFMVTSSTPSLILPGWGFANGAVTAFVNVPQGRLGVTTATEVGSGFNGAQSSGSANFTVELIFNNMTESDQVVGFTVFGDGTTTISPSELNDLGWTIANSFTVFQQGGASTLLSLNAAGTWGPPGGANLSPVRVENEAGLFVDFTAPGSTTVGNSPVVITSVNPSGQGSLAWSAVIPFTIAPGISTVYANANLTLFTFAGGDLLGLATGAAIGQNFGQTAGFSGINTPNGVTWTSGSFLSQVPPTSEIPEPSSWLLMAAPCAVLLYRRHKNQG
jgi:hypothetical protein